MIKKLMTLVCGLTVTVTLAACGSSENNENIQNKEEPSSMVTEQSTEVQKEEEQSVEIFEQEIPSSEAEEEGPVSNLDLDEARKWIYVPAECYAEDGSVIWEGDRAAYTTISRYYEEDIPYNKLAVRLNYVVEEYKAHGYAYVGDESDILSLNRDVFEEYGSICFKLELIAPVLLADLERTVLSAYIDSGKTVPED